MTVRSGGGAATRRYTEARTTCLFILLTAVLAFGISFANAEEPSYELDIPAQELDGALKALAVATDRQVLFSRSVVGGRTSPPVNGEYNTVEAMELLLADSGLTYDVTQSNVLLVKENAAEAGDDSGKFRPASSQVLMAQDRASAQQNQTNNTGKTTSDEREDALPIEEIFVTGTHIRGAGDVGASIVTFTREDLQYTGIASVQELMERLPQNLDSISTDGATGTGRSTTAAGNNQGVSSVSLRGLGAQSTLVLLNGKRRPGTIEGRAVDISNIPLAMIERIEVLTGGHSAIYGSDAVAGVVNIILRKTYEGAETQVYAGGAGNGGDRKEFTQVLGKSSDRGDFTVAYTYSDTQALDATHSGAVRLPASNGLNPIPGAWTLIPESKKHALVLNGNYQLTDAVDLYADALLTNDKNESTFGFDFRGLFDASTNFDTDTDQYSGVVGARIDVGNSWQFDVSLNHGVVDQAQDLLQMVAGSVGIDEVEANEATLSSLSIVTDGPIGSLGGIELAGAFGVEFREENIKGTRTNNSGGVVTSQVDLARTVRSVFAEINTPIVQDGGPGMRELILSIAGRYDDYTDAGSTFNPQIGVRWSPAHRLSVKGSYSTAYRAPDLFTKTFRDTARIETVNDPLSSTGTSDVFMFNGVNPNLEPEEADTWSLGLEYEPVAGVKMSASYFDIDYKGQIAIPAGGSDRFIVLQNEAVFSALLNRNPSAEELASVDDFLVGINLFNRTGTLFDPATQSIGDAFPNLILFDNRRSNVSAETMNGYDFSIVWDVDAGDSDFSFAVNGTRYLEYNRSVTATSAALEQLDRVGKPVSFRVRAHGGWKSETFSAFAYVNYVDSYENSFTMPVSEIDSWTTVDLSLRFDSSALVDRGFLRGTSIKLSVDNVFDEKPPEFLQAENGLGHDTVNANALGRFVSLRYVKSW